MTAEALQSLRDRAARADAQGVAPIMWPHELCLILGTLEHALACMNRGCSQCSALLAVFSAPAPAASADPGVMLDARGSEVSTRPDGEKE